MRWFLLFIAALYTLPALAQPSAGPMLGPVTRHTAVIWIQGDAPATVALEVEQEGAGKPATRTAAIKLGSETGYTAKFELDTLIPGTTYRYKLVWNDVVLDTERTFTTLPKSGSAGFTVYMGSCAHIHDPESDGSKPWSSGYEIFDRIATEAAVNKQPNLMLWLGDNVYLRAGDYEHPSGMARRYQKVRSHPSLQKLLATMPNYAIWDDHDYGPNDHNQSFVLKHASMALFQRYWPNPSAGLPETPSIFTQFSIADADFFLLDGRWHRDSDRDKSENKGLYGAAQIRWLKNALLASRARFKIIAGGSQFLNDFSQAEGWQNFRLERGEFLDWLQLNKVGGVVFLSGDRHHTELLRLDRADTYSLHELTCSPLTSTVFPANGAELNNPMRVAGTLVETRNYCTMTAEGQGDKRALEIKSMDAQGKILWEARLEAAALK